MKTITRLIVAMMLIVLMSCQKEEEPECIECYKYKMHEMFLTKYSTHVYGLHIIDTVKTHFSTLCDLSEFEQTVLSDYEDANAEPYVSGRSIDYLYNGVTYDVHAYRDWSYIKCNLNKK